MFVTTAVFDAPGAVYGSRHPDGWRIEPDDGRSASRLRRVPPEVPQTLDAVAGRADNDRSDSPATLNRQGIHDDPAATLVRPGADRTPPFRAGGRRLAPVPRPDRSGAVRGHRPPAPVERHRKRRLENGSPRRGPFV